jgi:ABC-type multidrug transport system fused ATPase/permease subunit
MRIVDHFLTNHSDPQTIPYGFSLTQATAGLLLVFTIGGVCNAGRAFLMRMSGELHFLFHRNTTSNLCSGQRIVARLRERTYAATLRQEVEFVERGEGDALSRLSVDSSIVGERLTVVLAPSSRIG